MSTIREQVDSVGVRVHDVGSTPDTRAMARNAARAGARVVLAEVRRWAHGRASQPANANPSLDFWCVRQLAELSEAVPTETQPHDEACARIDGDACDCQPKSADPLPAASFPSAEAFECHAEYADSRLSTDVARLLRDAARLRRAYDELVSRR